MLRGYDGCSSSTVLPKLGLAWRVTAPQLAAKLCISCPALPVGPNLEMFKWRLGNPAVKDRCASFAWGPGCPARRECLLCLWSPVILPRPASCSRAHPHADLFPLIFACVLTCSVENLYFSYLFVLRAAMKAAPLLSAADYNTGSPEEDAGTRDLMRK